MRLLHPLGLLLLACSDTAVDVQAWIVSSPILISSTRSSTGSTKTTTKTTTTARTTTTTTTLFNIPPPSTTDKEAFQAYANKQAPPASFFELQQDCIRSTKLAIDDGKLLLEVEFPPLPANVLELDDVSAYDVASANLNLAIEFAKGFTVGNNNYGGDNGGVVDSSSSSSKIQNVAIMLPDEDEARIAMERLTGKKDEYIAPTVQMERGITVSSLRRSDESDDRLIKPEQTFLNLFGGGNDKAGGSGVKPLNGTDLYLILVASAQELPDIEQLHKLQPGIPIVFYNLKLDILRGDLGAPAFPPKAFQDRFLSKVKPVYYLRTRQYSRSTSRPPFLVNYQGCLFRAYPGQYQTLLDTGTGSYRRLVGQDIRPALGEFKEQLTQALRDEGVLPQSEGSAFDFLRTGYKTTTWWEEEREESSDEWRT